MSMNEDPYPVPAAPSVPSEPAPPPSRRWIWIALLSFGALAAFVTCTVAYFVGYERGRGFERRRFGPAASFNAPSLPGALLPGDPAERDGPLPENWCFAPEHCARLVWPMELVAHPDFPDGYTLRVRQGANRISTPDSGLCEFVFETEARGVYQVWVHAKYSDDCGNSLACRIDGSEKIGVGNQKVYGRWMWECAQRPFLLEAGRHRLLVQTREDGLEFDRVAVIGAQQEGQIDFDSMPLTPPPRFDYLPSTGPHQQPLGGLEMEALATQSLVAAPTHRNELSIFVRLNGGTPVNCRIEWYSQGVRLGSQELRLDAHRPFEVLKRNLILPLGQGYWIPVEVRAYTAVGCVQARKLHFVRPFDWAFLGPIADPDGAGLNRRLAPEDHLDRLAGRPALPGATWRESRDGGCYDAFGVVDLNKVFGRETPLYTEEPASDPQIAYAVTEVWAPEAHHLPMNFIGDDCLQAWCNGRELFKQSGATPLETNLLRIGVDTRMGVNTFVFKIPQTTLGWQFLFEPDYVIPYSHPQAFTPVPIERWGAVDE